MEPRSHGAILPDKSFYIVSKNVQQVVICMSVCYKIMTTLLG